jgi:TfoX/Sxy family transcriptional regulator of competence genes
MFGGLCFMLNGNMFAGVVRDDLMLRLGKDATPAALTRPGAKPMDFTGRPMVGMVFVEPTGFGPDEVLRDWIEGALSFVESMPPKAANSSRPRRPRSRSG